MANSRFDADHDSTIPPKNAWLSERFDLGNGIILRMVIEDIDPRIKMVLEINETTSIDVISNNRATIKKYLQDLVILQGSDLNLKYLRTLVDVDEWHKNHRLGWTRLSYILNYLTLALLLYNFDERKKLEEKGQLSTDLGDLERINITEPKNLLTAGGLAIYGLFIAFNLTPGLYDQNMFQYHDKVKHNQLPFGISSGPFNGNRVRETMRTYQRQLKNNKIIIVRPQENHLEFLEDCLQIGGYFNRLNAMLDKASQVDWKRNRGLILRRLTQISDRSEQSQSPYFLAVKGKIKNLG